MQKLTVGDIKTVDRPSFQREIPLSTFRLLRLFGFTEVFGESSGPVLYMAGKSLGSKLQATTIDELLEQLYDLKIGLPKLREFDGDKGILRVYECMTCYGLPDIGKLICDFECGVVAGGLAKVTGRKANGMQKSGWTKGDKFCDFQFILY